MLPAYGLYGFAYYWPSWVHLLVIALMVVAGSLTLKALAARSAGRSRIYGLSCGFVAGLGNLSLRRSWCHGDRCCNLTSWFNYTQR